MVLKLKDKSFLRLRARGMAIEVVDGRVWITEDGYQGWSARNAMKRIFDFLRKALIRGQGELTPN